jgi:hypothetical protein|tara:strand:- start:130 stop:516 length:387 start_codon:yes stop_codon:yes gene_type:complete
MIEQIKEIEGNAIAFEIIDSFTETDGKLAHKLFEQKINQGHDVINVLIKVDELKINHIVLKAALQDISYVLKNLKQFGNLAIVNHSKTLKTLVKMDNLFYNKLNNGFEERYFDLSEIEEAFKYIETKN